MSGRWVLIVGATSCLAGCADDCPAPFEARAVAAAAPGQRVVLIAPDGDLRVEARERAGVIEVEVRGCGAGADAGVAVSGGSPRAGAIGVDTVAGDLVIRIDAARADVSAIVPAGASLDLTHGDGPMRVRRIVGDVDIRDGGGPIYIDVVMGSVRVRDGAGGIHAHEVAGDVVIEEDGSGEIDVRDVMGDFTVRAKSDDRLLIRYVRVSGSTRLPSDSLPP